MNCFANDTGFSSVGVASQIFASALQYFAAAQCLVTDNWPPDACVSDDEEFDFIVVGAGSAGSVVANRLSEEKDWKVLCIEAGDDPPAESIIPSLRSYLLNTRYNWNYTTRNDGRTNQASVDGRISWPRGKMIGGSSGSNLMFYVKGHPLDYQKWYTEGNEDWSPEIVHKYFKKAENLQALHLLNNPKIRRSYGRDGPLIINTFNDTNKGTLDEILNSLDSLGYQKVPDLNAANLHGSGFLACNAADGVRQSVAQAYLIPIQNRSNFKIMKNTLVTKIIVHAFSNEAIGVEVERDGKRKRIYATKEVIVCAGSVNTPQLLMLSGIGPKDDLESKGIECLVDSPMVGRNLQDHLLVPITIYGDKPGILDVAERNFEAIKYLYNRTGYYSSVPGSISVFFSEDNKNKWSEFQSLIDIREKKSSSLRENLEADGRYQKSVIDSIVEKNNNYGLYNFLFNLMRPESRGYIALKSKNPRDHPDIYPNYFLNPRDLDKTVAGIKLLTRIVNTPYFKSINAFIGRINWPPCDIFVVDSEEYWRCIAVNTVLTMYHPVGTCKMGLHPLTSVVDNKLKVHGVRKLRVIDASVMPTITTGNTNAPTIMIGERGSDLVKRCYGRDN